MRHQGDLDEVATATTSDLRNFRSTHQPPITLGFHTAVFPRRTGLELPRRLTFDGWRSVGRQLGVIADTSSWWLADWLLYGESHYPGRYKDAIKSTSLDYQTLRNYAWVARRFSGSRRRDALSFAHHAEVAARPEPEQDYWLRQAEDGEWSRNRLRHELQASLRERRKKQASKGSPVDADTQSTVRMLALRISASLLECCEKAATMNNRQLEEWAIEVLEHEAFEELRTRQAAVIDTALIPARSYS